MAEALGVISSVIAVLQLTGKLVSLGYEYIEGVKNAPDDIQKLVSELLSLSNVLLILQNNIRATDNKPSQFTALQTLNDDDGPLQRCALELQKLQGKLQLNHKTGFEGKIRRLLWPLKEKETLSYMTLLERYKAIFTLALTADQLTLLKGIEKHVKDISLTVGEIKDESLAQKDWMQKKRVDYTEKLRNTILSWISAEDFDIKHLEVCSQIQAGTGEWLMETLEFQNWIKGHPGFKILWGHGIPGAGKTFLSSLAIEKLILQAPKNGHGVGYVYFDYIEKDQQKPIRVVASLLKQLLSLIPHLPKKVIELHDQLREESKKPSFRQLYDLLIEVSKEFSRVFFIFDALDECDEREELLLLFRRLSERGISIFLTSRPHPYDIQESLSGVASIELLARGEDISTYIQQRIEKNMRVKGLTGKYKDQVISELVACTQGMFLLCRFHVEHICGQTTVRHILKELEKLKAASANSKKGPLDPTYDRVINGILKQPENSTELALAVLSWLVKARRTLTVDELQQALSVEPNPSEYELDELNIPDTTTLLDVCGGLVVIDENTKTVRLAHYTVQEYLLRKNILPDAEFRIATVCATYLTFDEFTKGPCKHRSWGSDPLLTWKGRFEAYPFLRYAAKHLSDHLRACDFASTTTVFLRFLENQGSIDSYHQALNFDSFNYYDNTAGRLPLAVASTIGHYPVVQYLLKNGADCSISDSAGETALQNAAGEGHYQIVELLLLEGADPVASSSNYRQRGEWTPLAMAATRGHKTIVELFLKHGIDFSIPENHKHWQNALNVAAFRGHTDVVKLLLENGPDAAIKDQGQEDEDQKINGWTSLYYAAMEGHIETVRLLLSHGGGRDISTFNKNGETALHQAVYQGRKEIVQLLLQNGANASIPDDQFGETVIHKAASGGHEQILQLLLKHGADTLALSNDGSTALHNAVSKGHIGVVRVFLESGENITTVKDKKGRTPLQIALLEGHTEIVRLLLRSEDLADMFAQDSTGRTELHRAAYNGYKDIVCILLENGADISVEDNNGWTALCIAASRGIFDVVQVILKSQAGTLVPKALLSRTLLAAAATQREDTGVHRGTGISQYVLNEMFHFSTLDRMLSGKYEAFQLLVEGDDILPPVPFSSNQFVLIPKAGRYRDVIQLLIENGADISVRDESGQSSLHLAAYSGQFESVQLLLENGSDIFALDHTGQTALHKSVMACRVFRDITVVYLLLEKGADISTPDNSGQTALHLTASDGWDDGNKLLLERGADPSVRDNSGKTAFHIAAYQNSGRSIMMFIERGVGVSEPNETGQTALHIAAFRGYYSPVYSLLEGGADVSLRDNAGMTPLFYAVNGGNFSIVSTLLEKGADASILDNSGRTVFHLMKISYEVKKSIELLIEKGADLFALDNSGRTALHLAASVGAKETIEAFLEAGLDISVLDKAGQTALHLAASNGKLWCLEPLLKSGADISARDSSGQTALHCAASEGAVESVKLLLKNGADVSLLDKTGQTALHLAASKGRQNSTQVLLENGADISTKDTSGLTAIHKAVATYEVSEEVEHPEHYTSFEYSEPLKTIQLLLEKGADPSIISNYEGATMDKVRRKALLQLLTTHGADDNQPAESHPAI